MFDKNQKIIVENWGFKSRPFSWVQSEWWGCLFPQHAEVFLSSVIKVFNKFKHQVYCLSSDNFLLMSFNFLFFSSLQTKSNTRTKNLHRKVALDVVGLFMQITLRCKENIPSLNTDQYQTISVVKVYVSGFLCCRRV